MGRTHGVTNQVPPLVDYDVADAALLEGLDREGAGWASDDIYALGRLAGAAETQSWGRLANEREPVLRSHDRFGNRIDEVEYDAAYHQLMTVAVSNGIHAAPWADERAGAHVARAAKEFIWGQAESGHLCPISMTYAIVPALRVNPELARRYEPLLTSTHYDFGLREPGTSASATPIVTCNNTLQIVHSTVTPRMNQKFNGSSSARPLPLRISMKL